MPEGDTIHRAATNLARAIEGEAVTGFRSPLPGLDGAAIVGATVSKVEARGKHLLVRFDDGRTLHTHMRMSGSWHLYRPGERWRRGERRARVVIETEPWVAVCFDAPVCELLAKGREPEAVRRLGPDLTTAAPDLDEGIRRLRAHDDLPLGVAVMRQDLVSGIGNVYKSEILFLERADPFAPVASVGDAALRSILEAASRALRFNLRQRFRTTRHRLGRERLWVYERSGKACFECGASIRMRRQGSLARSTYFCPSCQGVDPGVS